ncbi:SHOCT domain-containing protein [Acetobacterium malicum]|uniref:SHOCT domain-containing protein n=1 Tax=Acetobacterium malicum TaxID=52692 RepID=A0ABR6YU40_9FIRM|nr:SHOCT domain-containing protein [Acetobacterium malicum]MBC3898707.1 SHOCT domain-containing protein [Acetobacterium malicum]
MMYGIGYGGFGFFMMFGLFLLLVLVIIGVYFIVHHFTNSNAKEGTRSGDRALEILYERYARGEIDDEEYNQKKSGVAKVIAKT